jgi:hypothetical protein
LQGAYWRKQLDIRLKPSMRPHYLVRSLLTWPRRLNAASRIAARRVGSDKDFSTCAWRESIQDGEKDEGKGSVFIEVTTNTNHLLLPTPKNTGPTFPRLRPSPKHSIQL